MARVIFWSRPADRPRARRDLGAMPRNVVRRRTAGQSGWRAVGPIIAVGTAIAMIGFALFGPTGVIAWGDYEQDLVRKQQELAVLKKREAVLQNRAALLRPGAADPDMVDELVRGNLGVAHPDDVIVPLD